MVSTILCVVYYIISLCQKVIVKDNNKIIWKLGQMYAPQTLFIYFWLCWVFIIAQGLSLVAASGDYSVVMVHGLLIAVASLVSEHRF